VPSNKSHHEPRTRQLGITEPPPEHLLLAALAFAGSDPAACQGTLEQLRQVVRAELEDQLADETQETGELGFTAKHNDYNLTITVGFSTPGYIKLGVPGERQPQDLQPIATDVLDSSGANLDAELAGEGDLVLKICSNDIYVCEHVLRRVEHELSAVLTVLWVQTGVQRYNTRQSSDPRKESRALIGFLDGTANLNPGNADDRALIFTDHARTDWPPIPTSDQYAGAAFPPGLRLPKGAEPEYLDGGSYMAVEVLRIKTRDWDDQPRTEQERVVGRQKVSGEPAVPQEDASHVRKANPARPEDVQRRILRRGYALLSAQGAELARGLVFIAFGRTLSTQAEFIRRAWINNKDFPHVGAGPDLLMSRFIESRLVCGGYYFVPPLEHEHEPWSWRV
jgi:Dyp-type peroxidase family